MSKKSKWAVQINRGPTQEFETRTGLYVLAAGAALANLEYSSPIDSDGADIVKIWSPELVARADLDEYPQYGPMFYAFYQGRLFHIVPALNLDLVW